MEKPAAWAAPPGASGRNLAVAAFAQGFQVSASARWRNSVGVRPVSALNARLNGPMEPKPTFQRQAQHRQRAHGRVGEAAPGLGQPQAVHVGVEVAVAQPLVDDAAQPVLGHAQLRGEAGQAQALLRVAAALTHRTRQRGGERVVLRVGRGGRWLHARRRGRRRCLVPQPGRARRQQPRRDERGQRAQHGRVQQCDGGREPAVRGREDAQAHHDQCIDRAPAHDDAAPPAALLDQIGAPRRGDGREGQQREDDGHGPHQHEARQRPARRPCAHAGAVQRHPRPHGAMPGTQAEVVIEHRPGEQPVQHRRTQRDTDAGRLRPAAQFVLHPGRGRHGLHGQRQGQRHAGDGEVPEARMPAPGPQGDGREQQQRDQRAAQRRINERHAAGWTPRTRPPGPPPARPPGPACRARPGAAAVAAAGRPPRCR